VDFPFTTYSVVWVAQMLPSMKIVSSELGNYNILGKRKRWGLS